MERVPASALLLALLAVLAGCTAVAGPIASDTSTAQTAEVTVVDVIDGDTVKVRFADGRTDTVRLLGVDTPETHAANDPPEYEGVPDTDAGAACLREAGLEATAFLQHRLLDVSVTLVFDPTADRRGAYGRLLAYVRFDGRDVNRELVARGHARLYDSTFERSATYAALEATARSERRGLWRCQTPGTPVPDGPLRLVEVVADAEGDDREHLNGESVTLENAGSSTLDLAGWTLADAAGHVYRFPDGAVLPPGERVTVYTGEGTDTAARRYWDADGPVWNNDGDTAIVSAANGTVVLERSYG